MRKTMIVLGLSPLVLAMTAAFAQTVYKIPFSSTGNTLELTVANTSPVSVSAIKVEAQQAPSWLRFTSKEVHLHRIEGGKEASARFSFAVDKSAPVNTEHTLSFAATARSGELWVKKIRIVVAPPDRFELLQNYPNPFNPTTTISYQLPIAANTSLKIFNLLGQEVGTLFEGERPAGHHQHVWDAGWVSSGIYLYQLTTTDHHGIRNVARRPMLLLK